MTSRREQIMGFFDTPLDIGERGNAEKKMNGASAGESDFGRSILQAEPGEKDAEDHAGCRDKGQFLAAWQRTKKRSKIAFESFNLECKIGKHPGIGCLKLLIIGIGPLSRLKNHSPSNRKKRCALAQNALWFFK